MPRKISIISRLLMVPVYLYQWFLSPLLGQSCRHVPTCSSYTLEALRRHGPLHGLAMGTNRILRCRPGGTHGYDPVPLIRVKRYRPATMVFKFLKRSNRLKER